MVTCSKAASNPTMNKLATSSLRSSMLASCSLIFFVLFGFSYLNFEVGLIPSLLFDTGTKPIHFHGLRQQSVNLFLQVVQLRLLLLCFLGIFLRLRAVARSSRLSASLQSKHTLEPFSLEMSSSNNY